MLNTDDRAMEQFLASVERQAYQMAKIATSSSEDALDIVQDSMLGLVQRYSQKQPAEWKPLFFRIVQSRIRDWYRRNTVRSRWRVWLDGWRDKEEGQQEDPLEMMPDITGNDPVDQIQGKDSLAVLEKALHTLPLRQQQTFLLRAWQGMNVAETAKVMKCSEGSVKTHYSRAVHTLRKKLEDHWP